MRKIALLLAPSLLCAVPAMAVVDPPAASKDDGRLRSVVYDPDNPVEIYAVPGASLRIELGSDETVATIVVSDQRTIAPDPADVPAPSSVSASLTNGLQNTAAPPPSCDPNLCRSVVGNFVYLKPLRALDRQPLFIQTQRVDEFGRPQMVAYTFELLTRATDLHATPATVWGVRFVYPERVKAAQRAAWIKHRQDDLAREAMTPVKPVAASPGVNANWRYGYRGATSVQPDQIWDDGRSTFVRYAGNRRVPNVYNRLPDGHESIPAIASEPDATGNTLRIAHTEAKWFVRDGDEAGCLFDIGPDPDGKSSPTIAQIPERLSSRALPQ